MAVELLRNRLHELDGEWRLLIRVTYQALSAAMHNTNTPADIANWFINSSDSVAQAYLAYVDMVLRCYHEGLPPPRH